MSTTTVRLDPDDERRLDALAGIHGGRSNALRAGLKLLAAEAERRSALEALLAEWEGQEGPADEAAVAEMIERYEL